MSTWTTKQPRPGDVVLYCEHMVDENGSYQMRGGSHWFGADFKVIAPSGEALDVSWYNCCEKCYTNLGGDPRRLITHTRVGGHITWSLDVPVIIDGAS